MKTVIMFLVHEGKQRISIENVKKQVVSFVGTRMIEDEVEKGAPLLLLNNILSEEDKQKLSKLMPESVALVFLQGTAEQFDSWSENHITCTILEEEYELTLILCERCCLL